ncbi:MAG: hypothetical protein CL831_00685 [Crocinitomicaceae bacterium]|nr:hypothetical protein [Crocinitomicaceae bacterium]
MGIRNFESYVCKCANDITTFHEIYFIQLNIMDALVLIATIPVFISLYGVIKKQRFFFLLGYFLFSFLVVPDEISRYIESPDISHILFAVVFGLQAILTFPNKLNYDGTKVFKSFGIKTMSSLFLINVIAVLLINLHPESLVEDVQNNGQTLNIAMIIHGVFALIPLVGCYLMLANKMEIKPN